MYFEVKPLQPPPPEEMGLCKRHIRKFNKSIRKVERMANDDTVSAHELIAFHEYTAKATERMIVACADCHWNEAKAIDYAERNDLHMRTQMGAN